MHLGIIDIGSNSVRLIIAEIQKNGGYKVINDVKESLRLGMDVEVDGFISENKINATIDTLKNFKNLCIYMETVDIIIVATEAIRKASNKEDVLGRIKKAVNLDIRLLKGEEEAYLDGVAVLSSFYTKRSLVIDIGGSSTELSLLKDNQIYKCTCLPFGSINLTHRYGLNDIIIPTKEDELNAFLLEEFKKIPWLQEENIDSLIAIGGAARNLGRMDRKRKRYPLDVSSGYSFSDMDLTQMFNILKSKNLKQRLKVDGISKDRADIIVASTAILNTLVSVANIKDITVSGRGLREGILCKYINDNIGPHKDILDFSLEAIICDHNLDRNHAYNVYNSTRTLFEELTPMLELDDSYDKILKVACLLHDSGISIRYYDHHKHSFYIILNSPINGLSHKELIMAASIAYCHRSISAQMNTMAFTSIINRMDIEVIDKLSLLLRISEALDQNMMGIVKINRCSIDDKKVTIFLSGLKDPSLEIEKAMLNKDKFAEIFKKDLEIKFES
ncbi:MULTISPECIES: Ppx/GppA phosphatase family protein [Clostridium]|uniref:Ppx/GppA family phosphatase n=1 Tax=Clostridium cadaveris TaxID=1529 RepID=A0A316M1C3_9CLOT|nr:Ppx/GppA phosphatase family protein [Clostridium cadaveris]MDU4951240.1 Ppx/GppA phosphatase family protein [Clostridium sp.]MDY4947841.1 Ppx/GppA phosphatase family protein [Clostridium cadaveris]NME63916.1 Ppx/GppA family phosphatase [Clostridium cadaveris]PWL51901.1 MAG: Ppx/GppA family phosphatase [Clostridium cadaveris]